MTIYIKENQNNNFNLTPSERQIAKNVFDQFLKQYKPTYKFGKLLNEVNSVPELGEFLQKLDIKLLMNLAVSRLLEYSPSKLKEFSSYFNQALNFASCLEQETESNLEQQNREEVLFKFNPDIIDNLLFDFYKEFRSALIDILGFVIVNIVKSILKELIPYVDNDRINKCLVPCAKDRNPYKNLFAQAILKTGTQTLSFLDKKLNDNKLDDITVEQLQQFIGQSLSKLTPNEIQCLLSGFLSSDIIEFLSKLFKDLYNKDDAEQKIVQIFDNIAQIVDFVPGTSDLAPTSPCGDLYLENLDKIKLQQEGKSELEIQSIISNKVEDYKSRLTTLGGILDNIPIDISNKVTVSNSPITTVVFEKSIDATFDALGKNYQKTIEQILKFILINPLGDICLGFYQIQNNSIRNSLNLGNIQELIEQQLNPQLSSNFNPLDFFKNTENFYARYNKSFSTPTTVLFGYNSNNTVQIIFEVNEIVINQTNITITTNSIKTITNIEQSETLNSFILQTNRQEAFETVLKQNNSNVFERFLNTGYTESTILNNFYNLLKANIQKEIGQNFFFAEFNNRIDVKPKFAKIDFLNIDYLKQKAKDEMNG